VSCKDDTPIPTAYKIKSITIENFSATNGGNNWDLLDAPDIYIILRFDNSTVHTSTRQNNVDAGSDYTFNLNYEISAEDASELFQLKLMEYDLATDDQLIESYSFSLNGKEEQSFSQDDFAFTIEVEPILQ